MTDDPETPGIKDRVEEHWVCTYSKVGEKLIPATVWQRVFHEQRETAVVRELVRERTVQITRFEFKDIPREQFRLSKFGLPDEILTNADSATRHWYSSPWTVVGAILVTLLCGYACYRLIQRGSHPSG